MRPKSIELCIYEENSNPFIDAVNAGLKPEIKMHPNWGCKVAMFKVARLCFGVSQACSDECSENSPYFNDACPFLHSACPRYILTKKERKQIHIETYYSHFPHKYDPEWMEF